MKSEKRKISKIVSLRKREPLFDKHNEVLIGTITHKAIEILLKSNPASKSTSKSIGRKDIEKAVEKALSLFVSAESLGESHKKNYITEQVSHHVEQLIKELKNIINKFKSNNLKSLSETDIWCDGEIRRPDLILIDEANRRILIVDFKTGTTLTEDERKNYEKQLRQYTEAVRKIFPGFSSEALILFSSLPTKELSSKEGHCTVVKVDG